MSSTSPFQALADKITWNGNQHAFRIFRDKKFRQFTNFDNLSQVEQDRLFNELVVTNLVLAMLILESPDLRQPPEMRDMFFRVKNLITKAYLNQLKQLGIEKKFLNDWQKLINMRYEEYVNDRLKARAAAMEVESQSKKEDLDDSDMDKINLLLPLQIVVIGCHHHLCRQKTKGRDEQFKYLLKQFSPFYLDTRITLEGDKLTAFDHFRAKLKHWLG